MKEKEQQQKSEEQTMAAVKPVEKPLALEPSSSPEFPDFAVDIRRNPTLAMMFLYNHRTGELIGQFKGGTWLKNVTAISKALKYIGIGPINLTDELWRGDLIDYYRWYNNRRRISVDSAVAIAAEHDSSTRITDYSVLTTDWTGAAVNGGHNTLGCLLSHKNKWKITYTLGISPKMAARIDDLKRRSTEQQMTYVRFDKTGLEAAEDSTSFTAAVKYVMVWMCKYSQYSTMYRPGIAADKLFQFPAGVKLATAAKEYFIIVRNSLDESNMGTFKKAKFYVPALLVALSGKPDYLEMVSAVATGMGLKKGSTLLKLRNFLVQDCAKDAVEHRDVRRVKDTAEQCLAHFYAAAVNEPLIELKDIRGARRQGRPYSRRTVVADRLHREKIIKFFTDLVVVPGS